MLTAPELPLQPLTAPLTDEGATHDSPPAISSAYDGLPPLNGGDVATKVLIHAMQGDPAIVVESPPGAGKTTLVAMTASWLSVVSKLKVAIAAQRVEQGIDVANRIASIAPAATVTFLGSSTSKRDKRLAPAVEFANKLSQVDQSSIVIASSAKLEWAQVNQYRADVMLVDEAFQLVWGTFATLARSATQFVFVGDPGQIPPVVTADVSDWEGRPNAPHLPAPYVFRHYNADHVVTYHLPNTRRCGTDTAEVLQPFYSFTWGSVRPDRTVTLDGEEPAELATMTVESDGGVADPVIAQAVADRARRLATEGTFTDENGNTRPLTPSDVGVMVAHNMQATNVAARLADLPDITVGTLDSIQGREFLATVLWSPLAGKTVLSGFDVETGRLCVGLSRHIAHCTVVERHDTRKRFADALGDRLDGYEVVEDALRLLDTHAIDVTPDVTVAA